MRKPLKQAFRLHIVPAAQPLGVSLIVILEAVTRAGVNAWSSEIRSGSGSNNSGYEDAQRRGFCVQFARDLNASFPHGKKPIIAVYSVLSQDAYRETLGAPRPPTPGGAKRKQYSRGFIPNGHIRADDREAIRRLESKGPKQWRPPGGPFLLDSLPVLVRSPKGVVQLDQTIPIRRPTIEKAALPVHQSLVVFVGRRDNLPNQIVLDIPHYRGRFFLMDIIRVTGPPMAEVEMWAANQPTSDKRIHHAVLSLFRTSVTFRGGLEATALTLKLGVVHDELSWQGLLATCANVPDTVDTLYVGLGFRRMRANDLLALGRAFRACGARRIHLTRVWVSVRALTLLAWCEEPFTSPRESPETPALPRQPQPRPDETVVVSALLVGKDASWSPHTEEKWPPLERAKSVIQDEEWADQYKLLDTYPWPLDRIKDAKVPEKIPRQLPNPKLAAAALLEMWMLAWEFTAEAQHFMGFLRPYVRTENFVRICELMRPSSVRAVDMELERCRLDGCLTLHDRTSLYEAAAAASGLLVLLETLYDAEFHPPDVPGGVTRSPETFDYVVSAASRNFGCPRRSPAAFYLALTTGPAGPMRIAHIHPRQSHNIPTLVLDYLPQARLNFMRSLYRRFHVRPPQFVVSLLNTLPRATHVTFVYPRPPSGRGLCP